MCFVPRHNAEAHILLNNVAAFIISKTNYLECANYEDIMRGISMEDIEHCSDVYGILSVDSEVENVEGWKLFTLTGCIQVDSTQITNVDFMENFKNFTPLPMCKSCKFDVQLCLTIEPLLNLSMLAIIVTLSENFCGHPND